MPKVYTIGRSHEADIPIHEISVSRLHAELTFGNDGRCRIRDRDSTHGTFVFKDGRWKQIRAAIVDHDDLIRFGNWQVKVLQLVKSLRLEEEWRKVEAARTVLHFREPAHRLAAILFADVVGYSRMMHTREAATLAALKSHRDQLIGPKIAEHGGHLVKGTGDGVLAEFASVNDAVQCAVKIQCGMAERNDAAPESDRMMLRIGINLGEIIIDDDDIFGDGVNLAARLEGLASAGGICVSAAVYEQVKNRPGYRFEDMGKRQVKNIAEPIQAYALVIGAA